MYKYWLRNSNEYPVTFGNISEVSVNESEQSTFEAAHPDALPVSDGSEMLPEYLPCGDTVYGPAFPFGAEG